MQIMVTFKNIDSSESLKSYVIKKLDKFDRLLDGPAEAHVVLSVEKIRHIAELTLTCDRINIHAREESESMYSSIDALVDKIRAQVKKNKEKIKRHMSGKKHSLKTNTEDFETLEPWTDPLAPDDIIMETIDTKPMDIDDAVAEFISGRQAFFVFNNARTEQLNVLYKHNNGKLGLIQPGG
ncbi:ribosome hibernation-promoting factor, HPF/YfiA family [Desulfospira joergensenii]|uniref:ribosome hibernation-promoting factor, HPF/YfiA family n=1 Tax=Desulfospira joergensenii TaxID=53329 RepID=UPI0003B693C0|nr:ribosome-associated translation inhibitor RaiA [Desulfospira joergensenii]